MARVHLIRHGQASFGADDYDALSPKGHDQAQALARRLPGPSRLVSGVMRRHIQTAAAFGDAREDARWNEFDFIDIIAADRPDLNSIGALRGAVADKPDPHRAFQTIYEAATNRWASGNHDADYAEDRATFRARVRRAMAETVASMGREDHVYVVTSGGPIAAIVQDALGLGEEATRGIERTLVNCGVTTLAVRRGQTRLISLNEHQILKAHHEHFVTFR